MGGPVIPYLLAAAIAVLLRAGARAAWERRTVRSTRRLGHIGEPVRALPPAPGPLFEGRARGPVYGEYVRNETPYVAHERTGGVVHTPSRGLPAATSLPGPGVPVSR